MFFVSKMVRQQGMLIETRHGRPLKYFKSAAKLCKKVGGFIRDDTRDIVGQSFNSKYPRYIT